MKRFATPAAEVIRRAVEAIEGDDDFGIKDISNVGQEDYWHQIDGDANPWIYGGSWYNPAENEVIHFDGIEYDHDIEPDDIPIPPQMQAKLPPEQPDWRDNWKRDEIIGNYQYARAEFLNNRKPRTFWKFLVPRPTDSIFDKYDDKIAAQFDEETRERYKTWPPYVKLIEIGRYIGFDSIGDTFQMNYKEAQALLGPDNI